MTHPFHPRYGEELDYFEYRRDWNGQRVYFHDETGCLTSLPAGWTDVVAPDELEVLGAGRALYRVGDLMHLAELLDRIRSSFSGEEVSK